MMIGLRNMLHMMRYASLPLGGERDRLLPQSLGCGQASLKIHYRYRFISQLAYIWEEQIKITMSFISLHQVVVSESKSSFIISSILSVSLHCSHNRKVGIHPQTDCRQDSSYNLFLLHALTSLTLQNPAE